MNNHHHHNEMYYDQASSRSPGSHRHQQQMLHRQPSRHFDAYGQMPNNVYAPDDQSMRYDTNRFDRMNGQVQGNGFGYELPQAQTWNPNAFSTNNNFAPPFIAATGRMKSQTRGRSALPTVCITRSPGPGNQSPLADTGRVGVDGHAANVESLWRWSRPFASWNVSSTIRTICD